MEVALGPVVMEDIRVVLDVEHVDVAAVVNDSICNHPAMSIDDHPLLKGLQSKGM